MRLAEDEVCFDPAKPSYDVRCALGLACKMEKHPSTTTIRCTKQGAPGAACGSDSDCIDPLGCIAGTCGPRIPDGGSCATSGKCATGACSTITKTCVPYEYGATGAFCDSHEKRCARGRCIGTPRTFSEGTCVDPIPDGAPCTATSSASTVGCDTGASCIDGTCRIFDPASCR